MPHAAFDKEIVSGSILRSVWKLAWPMALMNIVNGLHGFVDHVLVGHYIEGSDANAAIGVAWQLFLVMVVFIASLFNGMAVLVARYSGQRNREAVAEAVYHTFLASILIHVCVAAPLGYVLSPWMLEWANAAPEVQVYALPYIRILFVLSSPMFLMFMLTGAFQASGNPKIPLALSILTTATNVVLSIFLITGLGPFPRLGVTGAALATVASPLPSVAIAIYIIVRGTVIVALPKRLTLLPDLRVLRTTARIGIPTGVQAVLLNIGGAFLLRYIGSLDHSAAAQAAYTICYSQLFSFVTWASFGLRAASSALMGQNIGAGDTKRGMKAVQVATILGVSWAVFLGAVFWTMPGVLLGFFAVTEGLTLELGVTFLRFLAFSGLFLASNLALTGGLQGAGDTKSPMWIALVTQIVVLLGLCEILQQMSLLTPTSIWAAILVSHTLRLILTYLVFHREKWMQITLEH